MKTSKEYLSGTLSTIVLALLKENGKMYGYEICQLTKERTKGNIELTEGAIYPTLHKLEKKGFILSSKEKVNGRTRKYYEIIASETSAIDHQIATLNQFVIHIQNLLKPSI